MIYRRWGDMAANLWTIGVPVQFAYFGRHDGAAIDGFWDGTAAIFSWIVLAFVWPFYWLIFRPA